jgi:pyruvate/2-oxoglutarate dehydrogenase complex dihydrolipoamide acyltransferase (E2) component
MPQLGESVDEGVISQWLVDEGEQIKEYDPLLEVNTDKVDTEIPSPASGTLLKKLVSEGTTVNVGTVLAWIGEPGEEIPGAPEGQEVTQLSRPQETTVVEAPPEPQAEATRPIAAAETQEVAPAGAVKPGRDRQLGFISPVVARIASQENVDLYQVEGTGQNGRITKKDILAYIQERGEVKPVREAPPTPVERPTAIPAPTPGEVVPLTPVRRSIADHMVFSKRTSPHVTTVMEADLSQVVAHRKENKPVFARDGVNLTFTAYFVAAAVSALKAYPIVNSSWSDEGIIIHPEINIGMATSLGEQGLIVPVIKQADSLSLLGLARSINDLSGRARTKKLKPDEVKGGTFSITNHGTTGSLFATPIINQPQCAILGVGAIQKRVVVINDAIAIRPMVYLTLTFDHRILDGAIADTFLGEMVESLENYG